MATRDLSVRIRDRLTAVRRAVLRRRRLLAVLCAVGAVAAGLRATAPAAAPTDKVLVAVRDLPAGAVLDADDLRTVEVAPDRAPAGVLTDPTTRSGAILAAPCAPESRSPTSAWSDPGLVDSAPGTVALPVRVSDAAQVGLLEVGDEIDLLATDPESRTTRRWPAGCSCSPYPASTRTRRMR